SLARGAAPEGHEIRTVRRQGGERAALVPPREVRSVRYDVRYLSRRPFVHWNKADGDDSVRVPVRQGAKQHRMDHAEQEAVGAGPEREREHRDEGEAGAPSELAERVAEVTHT